MAVPAITEDVRHCGEKAGGCEQERHVGERCDEKKRDERELFGGRVVATELEAHLKDQGVPEQQAEHNRRRHVPLVWNEQGDHDSHGEVGAGGNAGHSALAVVHSTSPPLACLADKSLG